MEISVKCFDRDGVEISALSKSPCHPAQLNSILSLCEDGYSLEIRFSMPKNG